MGNFIRGDYVRGGFCPKGILSEGDYVQEDFVRFSTVIRFLSNAGTYYGTRAHSPVELKRHRNVGRHANTLQVRRHKVLSRRFSAVE